MIVSTVRGTSTSVIPLALTAALAAGATTPQAPERCTLSKTPTTIGHCKIARVFLLEGAIVFGGSWAIGSMTAGLSTALNPDEVPPRFTRKVVIPLAGPFLVFADRRLRLDSKEFGLLVAYSVVQSVGAALLVTGTAFFISANRRRHRRRWALQPGPGGFSLRF